MILTVQEVPPEAPQLVKQDSMGSDLGVLMPSNKVATAPAATRATVTAPTKAAAVRATLQPASSWRRLGVSSRTKGCKKRVVRSVRKLGPLAATMTPRATTKRTPIKLCHMDRKCGNTP